MEKIKKNRTDLIKFVTKLSEEYPKQNDEIILQSIKEAFDNYLQENPHDVDVLLLYALFFYEVVLEDIENAIEVLEKVLQISPLNPYALLILAYIYHYSYSGIRVHLLNQLDQAKGSNEIMSMIQLARAWHFESSFVDNEKGFEEALLKSVSLDPTSVKNNYRLGKFYFQKNEFEKARCYLLQAKRNIVLNKKNPYLPSVEEFLNERYRGIYGNEIMEDSIEHYLKKLNFK